MKQLTLTSAAHPLIKEALKIKERRGRYGRVAFVIEGPHLIEMAHASPAADLKQVFFTEDFSTSRSGQRLLKLLKETSVQRVATSERVIEKLADTETPQGIVAVLSLKPAALDTMLLKTTPLLVVCDGIRDPGNLG